MCDGISIVTNYRTQFSRILREGSFSELMERMKEKALVAQLKKSIPEVDAASLYSRYSFSSHP